MNPIFANDFQYLLADFGKEVLWGAIRTTGILATSTQDLAGEDGFLVVRGETPALTYATASLPGLKRKDVLSMEGVDYRVKHIDLVNLGLRSIAYLEPA